ncbi:hypothetical protein EZ313_04920 [Ramlibacter henchirensis]|uniref:NHL repeat containing protein n=1 Tax=Ramlibacter henchirensis TaxID=204072 RepID=A0A4Z0C7D1_9BURK|nr:hypothetical protein [Ramlibacter henchirensis]TFZ05995.1 hypothetical protein EZ313_04920 [Ramlibacter henchirensis]
MTVGGAPDCKANLLKEPEDAIITPRGQLVVADTENNRVLIWDQVPEPGSTTDATFVVGQASKGACTRNAGRTAPDEFTLSGPTSVWSDGVQLVVVDRGNQRVLIFDFPTADFPAAKRVIGQSNFNDSLPDAGLGIATNVGLSSPRSIDVRDSGQMAVADTENNRVLIWDTFPATDGQAADQVIGQDDFTGSGLNAGGSPAANTLSSPTGVRFDGRNLIVVDSDNSRVLVFRSTN